MPDNSELQTNLLMDKQITILFFFGLFLSFFWLLIIEGFKHKWYNRVHMGMFRYPSLRFKITVVCQSHFIFFSLSSPYFC